METVDLNVLGIQVDVPTFANGSGPLAAQLGVFTMRCNPLSAKHGLSYGETLHRLHHASHHSHHTPSSNELQSIDHDGNYKKTSAAYLATIGKWTFRKCRFHCWRIKFRAPRKLSTERSNTVFAVIWAQYCVLCWSESQGRTF